MTWVPIPVSPEKVTPEMLYDLAHKHRLVSENTPLAIDNCHYMAHGSVVIKMVDEDTKDEIATVVISDIVEGEEATVDFIPVGKHFSPIGKDGNPNNEPFLEKTEAALGGIFRKLIVGRGLRRLNATVPASRSRTYKALRECGFRKEGIKYDGIRLKGGGLENLVMMGMLADKE